MLFLTFIFLLFKLQIHATDLLPRQKSLCFLYHFFDMFFCVFIFIFLSGGRSSINEPPLSGEAARVA